MNRLNTATRGISSWRERLANPDRQWKRNYSAFETAVSWEFASNSKSGLPEPIDKLFRESDYGEPTLMSAVAEHKVDLPGGSATSRFRRGLVAFRARILAERAAAISTEFRVRCVVRITVRTAIRQRAPALGAELFAGDSLCPALRAAHPMLPTRRVAPWRP